MIGSNNILDESLDELGRALEKNQGSYEGIKIWSICICPQCRGVCKGTRNLSSSRSLALETTKGIWFFCSWSRRREWRKIFEKLVYFLKIWEMRLPKIIFASQIKLDVSFCASNFLSPTNPRGSKNFSYRTIALHQFCNSPSHKSFYRSFSVFIYIFQPSN